MDTLARNGDGVSVVLGTMLTVLLVVILVSVLLYYAYTFIEDLPDNPIEGEDEESPSRTGEGHGHDEVYHAALDDDTSSEPFSLGRH